MIKELEILKLIEALYGKERTDEEIESLAAQYPTRVQAWKEAFEEYPLYEVQTAINHFYVKKSSKTRPNIAQIKAILIENGASKEFEVKNEKIIPSIGIQYCEQDKQEGNMRWFVPDYIEVEKLIRQDYFPWVYNIYKPTIDEFHRCLEEYCEKYHGKKFRFYSDNDIEQMTFEEKQALEKECRNTINNFKLKEFK